MSRLRVQHDINDTLCVKTNRDTKKKKKKRLYEETDDGKFKCLHCSKKYRNRSGLYYHHAKYHAKNLTKCPFCDYECKYANNMKKHLRMRHSDKLQGEKQIDEIVKELFKNTRKYTVKHKKPTKKTEVDEEP